MQNGQTRFALPLAVAEHADQADEAELAEQTDDVDYTDSAAHADPAIHETFNQRCEEARDAVWAVIRQRRPDDPEHVWADVCLKFWRHYPRMFGEAQADLAAGKPSRHDFTGWLVTIALNHMIDLHRKKQAKLRCQADGTDEASAAAPTTAGASSKRRRPVAVLPLDDEMLRMPAHSDPQVRLVLHEDWQVVNRLITTLPAEERAALGWFLLREEKRQAVAARWNISGRTLRRRRTQAIDHLREALASQGYCDASDFRAAS